MIKTTFNAKQFDISITGTDEIIIAELMASIPTVTFAVVGKLGLHETARTEGIKIEKGRTNISSHCCRKYHIVMGK